MKILFVCHRFPYPPNRGGKIRPFHMIQHLGQKHSVVVASLAHSEQELKEGQPLREYCEDVIAEVLPSRTRWINAGRALFSSMPSSVAYFSSRRLKQRIQDAWRRFRFDAILVHCVFASQYVQDLSCGFRMLDFGDVDSVKWLDYAHFRRAPLSIGYRLEAEKLRRYEFQMAQTFDLCTATTLGEVEEIKKLNVTRPTALISNGVDLAYFQPRPENPPSSNVLVFLGRMDYFPNIDAVLLFARDIYPLIRQAVPTAAFRIVGSNPSPAVLDLAKIPGISVTGHVPDVRPYLLDAAVAVAPLRIARGTQNKILQFLALGIPVVTSPQAAKGIGAMPGKHFLVADGAEQFAAEVIRLLQDTKWRKKLSVEGREPLDSMHSWPSSMKVLDQLLERVPNSSGSPAND
jgi:hypothetical protein